MLVELDDGYVINTDKIIAVDKKEVILSTGYHPRLRWWKARWGKLTADITEADRKRIFDAVGIYRADGQIDGVQVALNVGRLNRPAKVSE